MWFDPPPNVFFGNSSTFCFDFLPIFRGREGRRGRELLFVGWLWVGYWMIARRLYFKDGCLSLLVGGFPGCLADWIQVLSERGEIVMRVCGGASSAVFMYRING